MGWWQEAGSGVGAEHLEGGLVVGVGFFVSLAHWLGLVSLEL